MLQNIQKVCPQNARFIKSALSIKDSIAPESSEVAILGRSNVGKSSFINMLLNQKLAKSSSTPGKTRLINFFKVDFDVTFSCATLQDSKQNIESKSVKIPLTIIDFPGFGYAKVDKKTRNLWDKNLSDFLSKRSSIKLFCHLIDARHRQLDIDCNIAAFLQAILAKQARFDCQILNFYTKADKLKKNELAILRHQNALTISTIKKENLQEIYKAITLQILKLN